MEYRVEQKYLCNAKDLVVLRSRLRQLMAPDTHTNAQNEYIIHSLYFDDYQNSGYFENEGGVDVRRKYRLRYYNRETDHVQLEVKRKENGYIKKISCPLAPETVQTLLAGGQLPQIAEIPPAYCDTLIKMRTALLRPCTVVEYQREAYVYQAGNVRVTLDKQITASEQTGYFLQEDIPNRVPLLPEGYFVLEVKYDELLPAHIADALGLHDLQQVAFSKYFKAREALKGTFFYHRREVKHEYSRFV